MRVEKCDGSTACTEGSEATILIEYAREKRVQEKNQGIGMKVDWMR